MIIKPQHIIVRAGSEITACLPGEKTNKKMTLGEDVVVLIDGQQDIQINNLEYDAKYGDDKVCNCGYDYRHHFDSNNSMKPLPCPCGCKEFVFSEEATAQIKKLNAKTKAKKPKSEKISGRYMAFTSATTANAVFSLPDIAPKKIKTYWSSSSANSLGLNIENPATAAPQLANIDEQIVDDGLEMSVPVVPKRKRKR